MNEMELPKGFNGKVYFYQDLEVDYTTAFVFERKESPDIFPLGSIDVDITFNISESDAKNQIINNLKEEKKRIQADTQMKLNDIDDRINSLLAIAHDSQLDPFEGQ